ncbi:TPA: LacI family transcriptional regulator [Klebsiella pneumoniae]|uniref:LacI family DNA-binding transcriptional regulator n=1 Tax=Klebsiella pneumoniae TaxID=573 RepID=UPI001033CB74|nr:LacI family DNA-binding transcriptional regulator [Klebsiella pneumoniae]HBW1602705.1 LacI family transcriptional regulator [Klebsiella pneumoniae]HDQ3431797.1 LacI family DNA-binding transcriptional regulator [Klebsiella pneumoniae]
MPITVKEIAKLAGVSVATVSRILNNVPSVKKSSYNKVMAIINEMGYQPNQLAKQLRTAKSSLILVILSDISNPFFSIILKNIENFALMQGYRIIYSSTQGSTTITGELLNLIASKSIEGVISLDEISLHPSISNFLKSIPWVLCGEKSPSHHCSSVCIDDEEASYFIVKKLIERGKRNIGLINHNLKYSFAQNRQKGFNRALYEHSLCATSIIHVDDISFEAGAVAFDELCNAEKMLDAVFTVSDILAFGAIHRAQQKQIKIPQNMAIIGFDDIPMSRIFTPPLSTIHQPIEEMAKVAVDLLIQKINEFDTPTQNILLPWNFIERSTH